MHYPTISEGLRESRERLPHLLDSFQDSVVRQHGDVVFGKIDACFEYGGQFYQAFLERFYPVRQCTVELLGGDLGLEKRLRLDQIADRLRLREIDASMQKAAHGELAGFSHARSARQSLLHQILENDGRSVRRNLDHVLSCVRVGLLEESGDHFVDTLAAADVNQLTENGAAGLERPVQPQQRFRDSP